MARPLAGSQSLPVYEERHHGDVRWSFPLPVLPTRGGSGPTWSVRTAEELAGGEHHRHVQAGQQQVTAGTGPGHLTCSCGSDWLQSFICDI